MGTILYLRGADFSANAIGKVATKTDITELFSAYSKIVRSNGTQANNDTIYQGIKSSELNIPEGAFLDITVCLYRVGPSDGNYATYAAIGFYDENDTLLYVQHFKASTNATPGNYVERYAIPSRTKYVLSAVWADSYKNTHPSGTFLPFSAYLIVSE